MHGIFKVLMLLVIQRSVRCCGDYYWRDYEGTIPDDAVPAGNNSRGFSYIGQAYIHNYGLLLGTVIPGKWEVNVPCYGVKKADHIIKILCAQDKSKLYWISSNIGSYKKTIAQKCPVLGGYDQKYAENTGNRLGTLHVGRTRQHGDVIIGNIAAYDKRDPWFYYPLNDEEIRAFEFEALMCTED